MVQRYLFSITPRLKQLLLLVVLLWATFGYGQSACFNADFETGTFATWQGGTGSCCPISVAGNAFNATIMTGAGLDPVTNAFPVVAPGSNFSARLGDSNTGAAAERLRYDFVVTPQSSLIIYKYAVVLEDPGHSDSEQPRFDAQVRTQNGQPIPCTFYEVAAGNNIPGFQNCCGGVVYKPWTTVGVDVSAYIGQTVVLEFRTGDCSLGGHYGYAYVDAECGPLEIEANYCVGTNSATLTAPIGFTYLWNTGQTSQTITINNPVLGTAYSCVLTSVTGCTATLNTILQPSSVTAGFTSGNACSNNATFNNTSVVQNGSIGSYSWNFGDGSPADTATNPVHAFPGPGTYNVTLTATSANGCTDQVTNPITVLSSPTANFTFTNPCQGQSITLTDASTLPTGTLNGWQWNLGNGTPIITTQNGSYVYPDTGVYNVSLIVTNNGQCPDTVTQQVRVRPIPTAAFTTTEVCLGLPNVFTNNSVTNWGNVTYGWSFGQGGATSTQQAPTYTYTAAGTYNAQLIVISTDANHTCADTTTVPVDVFGVPVASFTADQFVCLGTPVDFTNTSTITPAQTVNYAWDFGNGIGTSTIQNPTFNYPIDGAFTVQLIATTLNNCADTVTAPQNIYAVPVAAFTPDVTQGCEPLTVNFADGSTVASGAIIGWSWDFGNGTSTTASPQNIFVTPGTYTATLIVESGDANNSCFDQTTATITVHPVPVADFTTSSACLGDPISFTNLSTVSSGSIVANDWDFGDALGTSNQQNPIYNYPNAGSYTVNLGITTDNGCTDSINVTVDIFPPPVIDFVGDNLNDCAPLLVNFTDLTTVANGAIVAWRWDFGDGIGSSTLQNPTYIYTEPGTYSVTLQVTTNFGCVETFTLNNYITVNPSPVANFVASPNPTTIFDPIIQLTDLSLGTPVQWLWNIEDQGIITDQNPRVTYQSPGEYDVVLIVENQFGCQDTAVGTIIVNPQFTFYIPNTVTPNNDGQNDEFFGAGIGIKTYKMYIFNRWGERIFTTENPGVHWDCTFNGTRVLSDVYVYRFDLEDIFGGQHTYRGKVSVLR